MKIKARSQKLVGDLLAVGSYLAAAVLLLIHLWRDPNGRMLDDNYQDHVFFEWALTHAARVFTDGDNPLFGDELNSPLGVNLMANTSILGLAIPLTPVTLLFGVGVTFALITTLALAGTASAWYYVLSRDLVHSRAAAYLGGLFCGFAPAMISQATGHPNIAGQFVIPFIIGQVFRLREPGHAVRRGLVLAGLVVYQCFVNEEVLFLTAIALGVFLLVYLPRREIVPAAKVALPALGVTALAAGLVMAYPLWYQFAGPQAYHGLPDFVQNISADLAGYPSFSRRSIVGDPASIEGMGGATEENSFFGWPLLFLLVVAVVALWRHRAARALVVTGVLFALLSLGRTVRFKGAPTDFPGPWRLLVGLPLFDSVVPTRLALVVTPVVGLLLALLVDRIIVADPAADPADAARVKPVANRVGNPERVRAAEPAAAEEAGGPASAAVVEAAPRAASARPFDLARLLWAAALAAALVPLIPTPMPAAERPGTPRFFSTGLWREHLPADATVVPVPTGWFEYLDGMRWSTQAGLDFRVVGGYFLAPDTGRTDRRAAFGPGYPPTALLLRRVADHGRVPEVTDAQRAQARADIAYWRATTLVLPTGHAYSAQIRETVDQLVGPSRLVEDVWLWDVRQP